jgi:hypothetical protein
VVLVLAPCGVVGVVALIAAMIHNQTPPGGFPPLVTALWGGAYLLLGGLVLWQRPTLVIPRLMLALGVLLGVTALEVVIDTSATVAPAWTDGIGVALFVGLGALLGLMVHLFPTGRATTRRWRWPVRLLAVSAVGIGAGQLLGLDPRDAGPLVKVAALVLSVGYGVGLVSAVPSLVYRVWHAEGAERAQLKWFVVSVLLSLGWFTGTDVGVLVAIVLPPLAIAVAMTKYHLYDIDRIVSRTTSYVLVSGMLIATYVLLVTEIPRLLRVSSNLTVAVATLAAAALARPLLSRVQRVVDQRFNRARYDALRTIEEFGSQLRHEVDRDAVADRLIGVVNASLQPEAVTLWLTSHS